MSKAKLGKLAQSAATAIAVGSVATLDKYLTAPPNKLDDPNGETALRNKALLERINHIWP